MDEKDICRFCAKVDVRGPDECWPWTGAIDKKTKYGMFRYAGSVTTAHRVSWMIDAKRPVPTGLDVCHTCDNRPCVNPSHLFPGSREENMRDMVKKGRHRTGLRTSSNVSRVDAIRLSLDEKLLAHAAVLNGESRRSVAKRFGVSATAINTLFYSYRGSTPLASRDDFVHLAITPVLRPRLAAE